MRRTPSPSQPILSFMLGSSWQCLKKVGEESLIGLQRLQNHPVHLIKQILVRHKEASSNSPTIWTAFSQTNLGVDLLMCHTQTYWPRGKWTKRKEHQRTGIQTLSFQASRFNWNGLGSFLMKKWPVERELPYDLSTKWRSSSFILI